MFYVKLIEFCSISFLFSFDQKKIMKRGTILLLAISLCVAKVVSAQSYAVEHSTSNYTPLVNATLLDESNPSIEPSGSDLYQAIPIGFDFVYHDVSFNSMLVGENGFVKFEHNNTFQSFINIFECPQMNFQDDPLLSPIYYEVSGNPGNQIFKLEFVKSGFVNDAEQEDYINYQLWLYEDCNVFEFHFGDISIDSAEFDLFYNNAPAPFMGYGNNYPYFFYVLDGSLTAPTLSFNAANSLDSVPNPNSVYTFRNCYASISEKETKTFDVYPNPVSDILNLKFENVIEESKLTILNINGEIIFTDILDSDNSYSINSQIFPQDVYFIQVSSDKVNYSTKFVKI